jgi:hypothetical protein
MKKVLPIVIASTLAAIFSATCMGEKLLSVNLAPSGYHTLNVGDSIQITVTTDPEEVDKVELLVDGTTQATIEEGEYIFWWKATEEDTLADVYITAQAWLDEESLKSEDTLRIKVGTSITTPTYFPYTENSNWTYSCKGVFEYIDYEDTTYSETDSAWGTFIKQVIGENNIPGPDSLTAWEVWWILDIEYSDGDTYDDTMPFFIRIEEDSVYKYYSLDEDPVSVEPAVPELNDTWDGYDFLFDEYISYEVIANNAEVLGYRSCLKLDCTRESAYPEEDFYKYWAPNVGLVLIELHGVDDDGIEREELTIDITLTEFSN